MSQDKHSTRVLISMKTALLDVIDAQADLTGKNRSEFIRDAVRFYLQKGEHLELPKKETKTNEQPIAKYEGGESDSSD